MKYTRIQEVALPTFYESPSQPREKGFLGDDAFPKAQQALPFFSADVLIVGEEDNKLYLPYRQSKPAQGYWPIGGGVKNGYGLKDAMVDRFTKETGISRQPEDFIQRADMINHAIWSTKSVENIHVPHFMYLNQPEIAEIQAGLATTDEYDPEKAMRGFGDEKDLKNAYNEGLIGDGAIDVLCFYMQRFVELTRLQA